MASIKKQQHSQYEFSGERENESSFQNSLCVKNQKKHKQKIKKQRIYKQKQHGSWTDEEEFKFMTYLQTHIDIFQDKELRRKEKIFRQMAKFIKSRSSEQCRSHHQKYEIRYSTHANIIAYIQDKVKGKFNFGNDDQHKQLSYLRKESLFQVPLRVNRAAIAKLQHVLQNQANINQNGAIKKQVTQREQAKNMQQNVIQLGNGYRVSQKYGDCLEIQIIVDTDLFFA